MSDTEARTNIDPDDTANPEVIQVGAEILGADKYIACAGCLSQGKQWCEHPPLAASPSEVEKLEAQLHTMTVERNKLLDAWGAAHDTATKITSLLELMKLEFAKLQVQRDQWRQIAHDYRTMTQPKPLTSQGERDAVDPRPVGSSP
jgi:serine phosphatase RsbU (regulator of sigma subunit)